MFSSFSFPSRLLAWYSRQLDTHPLSTKALTSGIIAATGDFVSQSYIQSSDSTNSEGESHAWNREKTGRFFLLGAGLVAPATHFWYNFIGQRFPGSKWTAVLQRLACDQLLFAPCFTALWLASLWTLENNVPVSQSSMKHSREDDLRTDHSFSMMIHRLANTVPGVVVANWALWIPGMALNFRFVPIKYQVLFGNFLGFTWNIYLSYATACKESTTTED